MLTRRRRVVWGLILTAVLMVCREIPFPPEASAAGCGVTYEANANVYGGSTVAVGVSCSAGSTGTGSSSGSTGCHNAAGASIACSLYDYTWTPALGLYCQVSRTNRPPPTITRYHNPDGSASGQWYACLANIHELWRATLFWVDRAPAISVNAAAVAHHLVDTLGLRPPAVGVGAWVDPGFEAWGQSWWVGAPLWLWVDNQTDATAWGWHTLSASQSGVTVTASVNPSQVSFTTGDGATVTCASAGTPRAYNPIALLSAHSPSGCDYTYRQTNQLGDPGSRYTVSATVTWNVTYQASDGQHGGFTVQTHSADNPTIHVGQLKSLRR